MFDYRGLHDVLFMALYWGAGLLALLSAVYLLFRRRNIFMREVGPESLLTIHLPSGRRLQLCRPVRASLRLRRWAAAFLLAMAASHVWWYGLGQWCLEDDRLVRNIVAILLDCVTLVPLVMAVLLTMLQDRRRPLWPWLVAQVPVVVLAMVGMARRSQFWGYEVGQWWLLAVIAVFITYFIYALRQYGRWLLTRYADLEHKEVWQSLVAALAMLAVYVVYTSNAGDLMREYLSQVISIVLIGFLVWRVETLQELSHGGPPGMMGERS